MSKRIALFNHKGGVSKTTSTYNIGWMLSRKHKVLVVDADPQCNLSSLILGDDFEKYYLDDRTKEQNIRDGVRAAFEGKPVPLAAVECSAPAGAPGLRLLAGHANLSEYDAALTFAQTSNNAITTLQNLPGAFSELLTLTEDKYEIDYTLLDLNPSLSAINQNLFITSHAFIVPTNPDPFSLMAMRTLSSVLPRWVHWATTMAEVFADSAYPLPARQPKFLGTLIQRFNIRRGRAAKPYRDNIEEIKSATRLTFAPALRAPGMILEDRAYVEAGIADGYCLSEISDFQGLLPKSYDAGVPVFELTNAQIAETGPVLANLTLKRDYFNTMFKDLTDRLTVLAAHA